MRRQLETSFTWSPEEVSFYCANFLVNSTVALECGHYLTTSVLAAVDICTQGQMMAQGSADAIYESKRHLLTPPPSDLAPVDLFGPSRLFIP